MSPLNPEWRNNSYYKGDKMSIQYLGLDKNLNKFFHLYLIYSLLISRNLHPSFAQLLKKKLLNSVYSGGTSSRESSLINFLSFVNANDLMILSQNNFSLNVSLKTCCSFKLSWGFYLKLSWGSQTLSLYQIDKQHVGIK